MRATPFKRRPHLVQASPSSKDEGEAMRPLQSFFVGSLQYSSRLLFGSAARMKKTGCRASFC
jgi:hypothetical protein